MVASDVTGRAKPIKRPGIGHFVPSAVNWCKTVRWPASWRENSGSYWSPEQIAGWLKHTYPDDEHFQVSHETIYRSLFIQARGVLKKELLHYLRRCAARATSASRARDWGTDYGHRIDP